MKKFIILAVVVLSMASARGYSQTTGGQFLQNGIFTFAYQMAFPMGDLKDWNSDASFRGGDLEYTKLLTDNLAVGGHIGWQGFYEEYPRGTYEFPGGAVTTKIFKAYYTIPMHGIVTYYFTPKSFIQPFASVLVGVNYNDRELQFGQFVVTDESWNFSFAPELGVIVPFGELSQWGLNVRARYMYNVYTRTDYLQDFHGLTYLNVYLGLSYSF